MLTNIERLHQDMAYVVEFCDIKDRYVKRLYDLRNSDATTAIKYALIEVLINVKDISAPVKKRVIAALSDDNR